ncbi:MAG: 4Fe-4S binding protein [Bacteroidetes bacterium]|nr:4Fe-4S binding protein [Bacteroidota bacterium]
MIKSDKNIRNMPNEVKSRNAGKEKKIVRNLERPIQKYRFLIQSSFALLCIWIGYDFYRFAHFLESNGSAEFFKRPPGVDGFLPISSMMSFYYFISTGIIHPVHPAGMFIFLAIILMSIVFGKSFCSWLCPVGFISELIGDFGEKIFKRKLKLPKWIDIPLRSLKYLLLGFLFYAVFVLMNLVAVKAFLDSPYNQAADLKMYYFFVDISKTALIVIGSLFLLSIIVRNFWCRFLCPYGALLGIFSFLSPNKIKRNPVSCIDCGLCAKACPSSIKVDKILTVYSDECSTCLNCIDACPVEDTLDLKSVFTKKKISKKFVAIGVVSIFMAVTGFAMITGHWHNNITKDEYLVHYKLMDTYGHPTGTEAVKEFDKEAAEKKLVNGTDTEKNIVSPDKGKIKNSTGNN